jgi:hypothetical protein
MMNTSNSIVCPCPVHLSSLLLNHLSSFFFALKWDYTFSQNVLNYIMSSLSDYLLPNGKYALVSHSKNFRSRFNTIPYDKELSMRQLKGFLLACASLIVRHCCPTHYAAFEIEFTEFFQQYNSLSDFQNLTSEEWKQAHEFRNHLAISIQLISSHNNKLMLVESSALLCGIKKCMQGSNPSKEIKRFFHIFEVVADENQLVEEVNDKMEKNHKASEDRTLEMVNTAEQTIMDKKEIPININNMNISPIEERQLKACSIEEAIDILQRWQAEASSNKMLHCGNISISASFNIHSTSNTIGDVPNISTRTIACDNGTGLTSVSSLEDDNTSVTTKDSLESEVEDSDSVTSGDTILVAATMLELKKASGLKRSWTTSTSTDNGGKTYPMPLKKRPCLNT